MIITHQITGPTTQARAAVAAVPVLQAAVFQGPPGMAETNSMIQGQDELESTLLL